MMTDILSLKDSFKASLAMANESRFSSVGIEWIKMLEARYEILKEELIECKSDAVEAKRAAAKEIRTIIKAVKANIDT